MGIHRNEVLAKVPITKYFKDIIVPNLGDYYSSDYDFDWGETTPVVKCPLHDEDTPSFRYFPDTETCSCFGCRKGGNVISLHRHFANRMNGSEIDNDDAEEFLFNYFILGRETTTESVVRKKTVKKNNSDSELARFNKYLTELESSILSDVSISTEKKTSIYTLLDYAYKLAALDETDLKETRSYVQKQVFEIIKAS